VATIPQRELRNNVSEVLRRAEAGERMVVTVDGRPVAELGPVSGSRAAVGMRTLATLAPADDDWPTDQRRLREDERAAAVDPWA
jgi:prevent-host-death family protein